MKTRKKPKKSTIILDKIRFLDMFHSECIDDEISSLENELVEIILEEKEVENEL